MTYAGDLTLEETWAMLQDNDNAVLIDVRTEAEWDHVGIPSLDDVSKTAQFVEWNREGGVWNENFVAQAQAALAGADKDAPIVLLCRSGARSAAAAQALTEVGYSRAYNILGGFEGPGGAGGGWKDNLPSTTR